MAKLTATKNLLEENWLSGDNVIAVRSVAMPEYELENSDLSNTITFNAGVLDFDTLQDGTLTVAGVGGSLMDKLEIPSEYGGVAVTEISSRAFKDNTLIKELTIPASIRRICGQAFNGASIEKITFEDTNMQVVFFKNPGWGEKPYISYRYGDDGETEGVDMELHEVEENIYSCVIPSDTREIIFYSQDRNCSTYPYTTADGQIGNCLFTVTTQKLGSNTYYVVEPTINYIPKNGSNKYNGLQIGYGAFEACNNLTSITLPKRTTLIEGCAFKGCENLMTVSFTERHRIHSIGESAFENCTALEVVTMYDGVREIGAKAFKGCYDLSSCMLGDGLQIIGEEAFMNLKLLEEVTIPASVERIEKGAFYGLPPRTETRYIIFESPSTWVASETGEVPADGSGVYSWFDPGLNVVPPEGTSTIVWNPRVLYGLSIDDTNTKRNGDFLSRNYTEFVWFKLKKMVTPQVSRSENILSMTDPLGIADSFNIYTKQTDGSYKFKCYVRVD